MTCQIRLGLPEDFYDEKIRANSHSFASAPVETAAPVEVAPEPVKEKEAFDIKLTEVDPKSKIKIIKEIRTITGLGLKEVNSYFFFCNTSLIEAKLYLGQRISRECTLCCKTGS